jgi:hypothetical protein
MYATLITALVLAQPPAAQPPAARTPTQPQPGHDAAMSLDGNWTVVCLEKNGQPVADAKNLTVTVRNNVATFSDANKQKAMRFEFGPNNQIRVTEMEGTGTGTGTGRGTGTGTGTGAAIPPPPAAAGSPARNETKTGVFVLARDFFAVSLHDASARPATERPGAPGTTPPARVPPGSTPLPGTVPPPPATPPAGSALGAGEFRASLPNERPYCVVILKRSEGAGHSGTGTEPRK